MRIKYCSECRKGESLVDADVEIWGSITPNTRRVPYHAFLCYDHVEVLTEDVDLSIRRTKTL